MFAFERLPQACKNALCRPDVRRRKAFGQRICPWVIGSEGSLVGLQAFLRKHDKPGAPVARVRLERDQPILVQVIHYTLHILTVGPKVAGTRGCDEGFGSNAWIDAINRRFDSRKLEAINLCDVEHARCTGNEEPVAAIIIIGG